MKWKSVQIAGAVFGAAALLGYCAFQPEPQDEAPLVSNAIRPALTVTIPEAPAPPKNPYPLAIVPEQPFEEPYHPFLVGDRATGSVSVGDVTNGYTVNAKTMPLPHVHYDVLPRQRKRYLTYGTEEMISLIRHAAAALYTTHGTPLWLGNIGKRGGGDIIYSVSHNSGRDADLAFAYMDSSGNPVDPPDLVHLDENGVSIQYEGAYLFDTARTWTIVKALLTHPEVQVQYLFLSNPLKKRLLAHARMKREPQGLLSRAEAVLGQPGLALPHNDHLHIRIYCSREDIEHGCRNTGKIHDWVATFPEARQKRTAALTRLVKKSEDPEQRARGLESLAMLSARSASTVFVRGLEDHEPRVRIAAAEGLARLGMTSSTRALAKRFKDERDPEVMSAILRAVGELGGKEAGNLLAEVIADTRYEKVECGSLPEEVAAAYTDFEAWSPPATANWKNDNKPLELLPVCVPKPTGRVVDLSDRTFNVRLAAVEAAAESETHRPVEALVTALDHPDPVFRGRVARSLRLLTNHSFDVPWDDPLLLESLAEDGREKWRKWFESFGKMRRRDWIAQGFLARAYSVPRVTNKHIWELVRAIADDDYLSFNAQRVLMDLSGHNPLSLMWPKDDAAWHWRRWFTRRRHRFSLPKPPEPETK